MVAIPAIVLAHLTKARGVNLNAIVGGPGGVCSSEVDAEMIGPSIAICCEGLVNELARSRSRV
jgi:hypothetical protein